MTVMYRGSAKYTRVPTDDSGLRNTDVGFTPAQFKSREEETVPWKAVGLAAVLFVLGSLLLTAGCLIHTGHVDNEIYGDRYNFFFVYNRKLEWRTIQAYSVAH